MLHAGRAREGNEAEHDQTAGDRPPRVASGAQNTLRYRGTKTAESAAMAASARHIAQPVTKLASSLIACRASAADPPASGNIDTPSAEATATVATIRPATRSATGVSPSPWIATTPTAR